MTHYAEEPVKILGLKIILNINNNINMHISTDIIMNLHRRIGDGFNRGSRRVFFFIKGFTYKIKLF